MIPKTRKEAFEVLELLESAKTEEIKNAYRKLAKKWHPDRWSDKSQEEQKTAIEKFKEISIAYKISIDEITEEFISQQPNHDWINNMAKKFHSERYRLDLSEEEVGSLEAFESLKWHPDRWSDKSQEEQKTAAEKFKEIPIAHKILIDKITEKLISQQHQHNEDLLNKIAKYKGELNDISKTIRRAHYGLHLSEEEVDLFEVLNDKDLTKTKILLEKVKNINSFDSFNKKSILRYIVENSCRNFKSGWIELLEEVLSKYSANNSIPAHNSSVELCSQLNAIDVNILTEDISTHLYIACDLGNNDVAKVLFKHGAKIVKDSVEENQILSNITEYNQNIVETLLLYTSSEQKSRMLGYVVRSEGAETDHNIKIIKSLLEAGADPNVHCNFVDSPLYYALSKSKNDVAKVLFKHGAKIVKDSVEERLIFISITEYNQNIVETLLLHTSSEQKSRMLGYVVRSEGVKTNHNIKIIKSLLEAGADPKFCDTEATFLNISPLYLAEFYKKNKLVKLFNEHNSPQKQSSGISPRGWTISLALLFGAVGAILVAIGIIPEIIAIGVIATAVLSGIVGAALGGVVGYLTDITVNKCEAAVQVA